ncbi:carbohydrate ABC transporter permease [Rhizobium tubonense]|uniref:Sugar ABC transporter permease n=1 Tax=Rhizobium tubonense TaxID=484088 RepID=A0A2W4CJR4_9HYPH|nr:carbohydrate ABC transporter permease [Rhizobium tubonense]PZM13217.1 sugar ABC transporter permease [Rhizobium tubonense]
MKSTYGKIAAHMTLAIGALFILLPFLWMTLTIFRSPTEIFDNPLQMKLSLSTGIQNVSTAFTSVPMLRFMLNGVIVVIGILAVQISTSLLCGYALAKMEFRGKSLLLTAVILSLCIPVQVPALPIYLGLAKLHLLGGYFSLMFPWFLSAFAIFLFRQFFKSFPDEILSAARLEGFTEFEILIKLIVPSAMPAIAAFSVFSITAHWNDLYWPLIVINSPDYMTPPLGMMFFRDAETGTNYGALMAGAAIVTAPLLLLFLSAQRQFVQGVTMSGVK